jgi:hypothetical protein
MHGILPDNYISEMHARIVVIEYFALQSLNLQIDVSKTIADLAN